MKFIERVCAQKNSCMQTARFGILKLWDLEVDMFGSKQKAMQAADILIQQQRAQVPAVSTQHPDVLCPDCPMLDQFWYAKSEGHA